MSFELVYVPRTEPWKAPLVDDLTKLIHSPVVADKAGQTPHRHLWCSFQGFPANSPHPMYCSVEPTDELKQFISENSIYCAPGRVPIDLDKDHYLKFVYRGGDEVLIILQFQQICGSRYLARTTLEHIDKFFPARSH